jgi:GH24 family phage-related lysozyme (muramidase)
MCVNLRAPHLNENQFSACVSLVFNIGCAAFNSSTLLRMIRVGDYKAASAQFMRWVHDNGKFAQGLKNRRERERALFDTPEPPEFSNVESGVESTAPKA